MQTKLNLIVIWSVWDVNGVPYVCENVSCTFFFFLIFHFKMVKLKEHAGDLAFFFFLNHILLKKSQVQLYIFNKLNRARRS